MRTIAFLNQKGGSCKTTSAVNLAAALAEIGQQVLIVDLDPQASASAWLGVKEGGLGLYEMFTDNRSITDLVHGTDIEGVDLVPSSAWLVGLERAIAGSAGAETILRKAFDRLPPDRWDFVFLDCPPSLGFLAISALVAVQEVLVPVEPSAMALGGLASLVHTVSRVRERLNPDLAFFAILACRMDSRTNLSQDIILRLRKRFGNFVLKSVVRENVRLREAWSFAKPITVYAPKSQGAADYRAVAGELLRRTNRKRPA